ncbi:MAG: tyrosine-type recombinase/integrase [Lacipirellulaceae bacterium]
MASLFQRNGKAWSIQFDDARGARRTLSLGAVPKRAAEATRLRVEQLVAAQLSGTAPDPETSRWLGSAPDKLRAKLARLGLVEDRRSSTLGAFLADYAAQRRGDPSLKPATLAATVAAHKSLLAYFGADRSLRSITPGDAKSWRLTLAKRYAENTCRKRTAQAKTLFKAALDLELIDRNPFAGLKSTLVENRQRDYFVTEADAAKVLAACPSVEWRTIFALSRWGGLRCPSEVLALRWGDVLWAEKRVVVRCVKTEHHEGHGTRVMPLFPELAPILAEAFDAATPGAEYVVERTRDAATNLRTHFTRIVERAGLTPWPKLFQNLRATRATELADRHPQHVAAAWLGHSVKVAQGHYWQVHDEHFDAAQQRPVATPEAAVENVDTQVTKALHWALHDALRQAFAGDCTEARESKKPRGIAGKSNPTQLLALCTVGDEGLEPPTSSV